LVAEMIEVDMRIARQEQLFSQKKNG
jgi:hypothetical protein